MDLILSMIAAFLVLIISIFKGIFVGYPLLLCFLIFMFTAWKRGFLLRNIMKMSLAGGKKAFVVLEIFILIGAITGIWMAAGTVPGIVYYGIKYMNPHYFILYAFIISSLVSFLLGTSLGTVSTVGVALIVMAKSGNVNVNIAAGAIIAGAYFGDRCSPMSSSANLVANLTDTNLYTNIKNMFKTSIIPFVLSLILYYIISTQQPLNFMANKMDYEIINIFKINWIVLLPALLILLFSIFRIDIKLSMFLSIIVAAFIGITLQQQNLSGILRDIVFGFNLDKASPLQAIVQGGGIISMWKPSFVVFISCALAGIFDGTNMLKSIEDILVKARTRSKLFCYTTLVSIVTAALGSNQSISIVLTNQLMKKSYENRNISHYELAIDIENTGVILSALIPWNIAALVPTVTMKVNSMGFVPYAFYLYLIPISIILYLKVFKIVDKRKSVDIGMN